MAVMTPSAMTMLAAMTTRLRCFGATAEDHTPRSGAMVRPMTRPIRRVAVLGAGVMGSGIAAHCANAGIPVILLDIVPPDDKGGKGGRNAFASGALAKLKKAKPAAFMHARNETLVSIGNFDDDLAQVKDCDLIVEAVVERLDIKRGLFEKL